jgi:hypothetical protein
VAVVSTDVDYIGLNFYDDSGSASSINSGTLSNQGVLSGAVVNQGSGIVSVLWSVAFGGNSHPGKNYQFNYTMTTTCSSCFPGEWRDLEIDQPSQLRFPVQPFQSNIEFRMQWGEFQRKRDVADSEKAKRDVLDTTTRAVSEAVCRADLTWFAAMLRCQRQHRRRCRSYHRHPTRSPVVMHSRLGVDSTAMY